MIDDPKARFKPHEEIDPGTGTSGREDLAGSHRADAYLPGIREQITIAPDARPMAEQPRWRQDFAIDWPEDQFVARRDFAKFLVLTSGAFAVGQGWIAAHDLIRSRRPSHPRAPIGKLSALAPGAALVFMYPGEHDPCLLLRTADGQVVAYSQKCTHLSCAVVPEFEQGVLHCPCHNGYFDLETGRNIAGPPPRPLPRIELEVDGDEIYATGVALRTS